jgi:hypothetical protein
MASPIHWLLRIWSHWDSNLKREIHTAIFGRLVRHLNRNVSGSY